MIDTEEFEKAGIFYNGIVATEEYFRKKQGLLWQLFLMRELAKFRQYGIREKLNVLIKHNDKNNRFLEHIFSNKYALLESYYQGRIKARKIFAAPDSNPEPEEIRCLFYLLDEIFYQDCYKIKQLIGKGDTVVDIGANIGIFSLAVLAHSPDARTIAFEPASRTYATLKKNVAPYKNIEIKNMGLGAENATKELRITAKNIANRIDEKIDTELKAEALRKEEIKIAMLDEFIGRKAEVIKLDIEGYEEQALIGASHFINKHKPLIICANEHSKKQKEHLVARMKKINRSYKFYSPNEVVTCFYIESKHGAKINRLKPQ